MQIKSTLKGQKYIFNGNVQIVFKIDIFELYIKTCKLKINTGKSSKQFTYK